MSTDRSARERDTPRSKPLAILGATSRIAQDFVLSRGAEDRPFALYARRPAAVAAFLAEHDLPADWQAGSLPDFAAHTEDARIGPFCGVLNMVGVGDPAAARAMGAGIFSATQESDAVSLAHVRRFPATPYLFLSSGAVYGAEFQRPATAATPAWTPVNAMTPEHFYSVAKLYAEARHRAETELTIVDIRIFNYVSRRLDPNARFIVTDMARAAKSGAVFETVDAPMVRDYLDPPGMSALFDAALSAPPGFNGAVDAYSAAPIDKRALVALFEREFGMRAAWREAADIVNATGSKPFYFSENRAAGALGYRPLHTSAEAVTAEIAALMARV